MSDSPEEKEPEVVVDEDWKKQAQVEKEKAESKLEPAVETLPPADFPMLISSCAAQAIGAMGMAPDPVDGKITIRKPVAKHFIDMLAMLEEKTKGNLTADESSMLTEALHQLRMMFVAVPDTAPEPPKSESNIVTE